MPHDKYNKYTFFFNNRTPFSQWYPAKMVIDERTFTCAEQYMMFAKAETFVDTVTAEAIMATDVPWRQKMLGRSVKGFDELLWCSVRERVVKRGNRAKFSQHVQLRNALFATVGTTLVEASPQDCIWGIGLSMEDPRKEDPANWRGLNLLGNVLTELRDEMMANEHWHVAPGVWL